MLASSGCPGRAHFSSTFSPMGVSQLCYCRGPGLGPHFLALLEGELTSSARAVYVGVDLRGPSIRELAEIFS